MVGEIILLINIVFLKEIRVCKIKIYKKNKINQSYKNLKNEKGRDGEKARKQDGMPM